MRRTLACRGGDPRRRRCRAGAADAGPRARGRRAQASLLLNLEGVLTAALAWFVFREHSGRRIAFGMALIAAGGVVRAWPSGAGMDVSLWAPAVAGACLAWAIDNNLTRKVSAADPVQIAALKGLIAGLS